MTRSGPIYTCQYQYYYSASQRKPALLHKVNKSDGCNSGGGVGNKQVASRAASEADWSAGSNVERHSFCSSVQKQSAGTLFEVACSHLSPHTTLSFYMW